MAGSLENARTQTVLLVLILIFRAVWNKDEDVDVDLIRTLDVLVRQ